MKKAKQEKSNRILITMLFISMILTGMTFQKVLNPSKEPVPMNETQVVANVKTGTFIKKSETEDHINYKVEDYDRNLSYSWKFAKEENKIVSVEDSLNIDLDLRLSLNKMTKDTETITDRVHQDKLIVSFDHHGTLPLEATVRIDVRNRFKDHEKLYLYYFNPEQDQIEYIEHNVEVKDGYVEFTISHCSDYFLTGAVVNDAVNNPQSINYIIIGLVVIVFILIAVTLAQSKNK